MRLDSLKHIAHSVQVMMEAERIIVFGSASLLASFPDLDELAGSPLQSTYDADLIPYPFEEGIGKMLDEAFGEGREFHQRYGYHADIVRPKVTETFPEGWESRLLSLDGLEKVCFLEPHDMAAVKCMVGRKKDGLQLTWLLEQQRLDAAVLRERIGLIKVPGERVAVARAFLDSLLNAIQEQED
jgi:hypothetical protein